MGSFQCFSNERVVSCSVALGLANGSLQPARGNGPNLDFCFDPYQSSASRCEFLSKLCTAYRFLVRADIRPIRMLVIQQLPVSVSRAVTTFLPPPPPYTQKKHSGSSYGPSSLNSDFRVKNLTNGIVSLSPQGKPEHQVRNYQKKTVAGRVEVTETIPLQGKKMKRPPIRAQTYKQRN